MAKPQIWMNGEFVEWDAATVHVLSHSLQRGSTVFESLSCQETTKGPAICRLDAHIDRFLESGALTGMRIPFSREELIEGTIETVRRSGIRRCCIRPLAFYVGEELEVVPKRSTVQVTIAVASPIPVPDRFRAKVSSFRKLHPDTVPVAAKVAGNYLSAMLAKREALDEGFDEAILLDCAGNVAEGPTESLFIVHDGTVKTARLGTVLAGITRDSVIRIASDVGYRVEETTIPAAELYEGDELFVTGTGAGVVPIVQLDDSPVSAGEPGEITESLRKEYADAASGRNPEYESWLTYV
jgi:branched-chain amino acid aminotransferase